LPASQLGGSALPLAFIGQLASFCIEAALLQDALAPLASHIRLNPAHEVAECWVLKLHKQVRLEVNAAKLYMTIRFGIHGMHRQALPLELAQDDHDVSHGQAVLDRLAQGFERLITEDVVTTPPEPVHVVRAAALGAADLALLDPVEVAVAD
jgi:hypothetical protein